MLISNQEKLLAANDRGQEVVTRLEFRPELGG